KKSRCRPAQGRRLKRANATRMPTQTQTTRPTVERRSIEIAARTGATKGATKGQQSEARYRIANTTANPNPATAKQNQKPKPKKTKPKKQNQKNKTKKTKLTTTSQTPA
ncbi:hypothetical protein, partial [Paraburkholderia sp. XV]|uniref:hypothetical protein n=1 Tax=Paraburkholderia sp. XV TaxID=2831520 RepID=UPI001CD64371